MMESNQTHPPAAAPVGRASDRRFRTEHLRDNLGARTARGGAVMIGAQVLRFVITMASTVVLARLLTPQDYGFIGMVAVVLGFVALFKNMGLSLATIQREEINAEQVSTLFWINVALSLALTLVTVALAPAVALFYGEPRLTLITAALAAGFVFGGLTVQHEALLKRQMRFASLAVIEIISLLGGLALAIALAARGVGYWALVANQLVYGIVYAAGVWIACRWLPGSPSRAAGVRSMLRVGGNLTGYGVLNYFARNADNLLIGRLWGAQQLGLYAKAYQLLLLPIDQTSAPLDSVVVTSLSKVAGEPDRYRQAYLRILEKITMLTMPGIALMIATSDLLVRIVLGPQWSEAALIFALLGIVGLFEPAANTMGWLLISQGRTRDLLRWGFVYGTFTVASIIIGLPWGAVGVAASFSIVGVCVRMPLLFWYVGRVGPVRAGDIWRAIAPSACAAACVLATLFFFRRWLGTPHPLLGLLGCSALAAFVALAIFVALPGGRRALLDAKAMLPLLLKRRPSEIVSKPSEQV